MGLRGSGHGDLVDLPIVYQAAESKPESDLTWCYGTIGSAGPTSVAVIVRRFLDTALAPSPTPADAADLINEVPGGFLDPLGVGH